MNTPRPTLPTLPTNSTRRRLLLAAVAAGLSLGSLAACGDDDSGDGATSLSAGACDAYATMGAAMMGDHTAMGPASQALRDEVPADLTDHATTIADAVTSLLENDDPSGFESPEYAAATSAVGAAVYEQCASTEKLDVTGIDFGFEGLPGNVKAGRVAVRFTNGTTSNEMHELMLFRRLEGTTETIEELFEVPEDELMSKIQPVGVTFADEAGATSVGLFDLEAGEYIAICMIPVGGGEDGPPHAIHGMVAEVSVA